MVCIRFKSQKDDNLTHSSNMKKLYPKVFLLCFISLFLLTRVSSANEVFSDDNILKKIHFYLQLTAKKLRQLNAKKLRQLKELIIVWRNQALH